jgi:hypothetical protein
MKRTLLLMGLCILAGTGLNAQTLRLEDITAKYDDLVCTRIERSADTEAFREQALMNALFDQVLRLPAGAVRETEREGDPPKLDAAWIFFNPQENAIHLAVPSGAKDLPLPGAADTAFNARYRAEAPVKICTGRQDAWTRTFFTLHYSFDVYAPNRASLESVRQGKAPLNLRMYHLEEKLLNSHDLYLHFTGVLEP